MASLKGKRAWITGGGSGIGAAAARALAEAGAEVIVSGRRKSSLEKVVADVQAAGGKASFHVVDVSDARAVESAAESIGAVDILVANAGSNVPDRSFGKVSADGWDSVIGVNLNGVFYAVRAVLPGMRERGGGLVMLVSSWAGRYATRLAGTAYNASKRAVLALGETLNEEEGANGIRCTMIMPGEVATDILKTRPVPPSQMEMDRMLTVEDMGRTIRFVAEMPAHVCINEILISPTWNRFYQGFEEAGD